MHVFDIESEALSDKQKLEHLPEEVKDGEVRVSG